MFSGEEFRNDPYQTYQKLREAGPIHWIDDLMGGVWLLTRHHDIEQALADHRLSSERGMITTENISGTVNKFKSNDVKELIFQRGLVFRDPPIHTVLRKALMRGFNRTALDKLRPTLEADADRLLSQIKPNESFDLIEQFVYPWHVTTTLQIVGVEREEISWFMPRIRAIANYLGRFNADEQIVQLAEQSMSDLNDYFHDHLPQWRLQSPGGLLGYLLEAEATHDEVTEKDVAAQFILFFSVGIMSTPNFLAVALLTLLQHPEQLALLKSDTSLYPDAIRELSRYETTDPFATRKAVTDFTLLGESIKSGDGVMLLYVSANRDPEQYTDPDRLNLQRAEGNPLTFGKGPHTCIGSQLAKLELEIMLKHLFNHFSNIELMDTKPDWSDNTVARALSSLRLQTYE